MLIPLGLGLKPRNYPWVTITLIVFTAISFFWVGDSKLVKKELAQIQFDKATSDTVSKLYLEYCLSSVANRKACLFNQSFFQLKRRKGELERAKLPNYDPMLNDIGNSFQQSQHFKDFYKKLLVEDESIKVLFSFKEYQKFKNKISDKLAMAHYHYKVYSKLNSSTFFLILSLFSSFNIYHLLFNLFLFGTLSSGIEKKLGPLLYGVSLIIVGISLGKLSLLNVSNETSQYLICSPFLLSFIIGCFRGSFHKYHLKFAFWQFNRLRFVKVKVTYALPILFLVQIIFIQLQTTALATHYINFFALGLGVIVALILQRAQSLPPGFLFKKELLEWEWIQQQEQDELFFERSLSFIENYPLNFSVREKILSKIKLKIFQGRSISFFYSYLVRLLGDYLKDLLREKKDLDDIVELIKLIPKDKTFHSSFSNVKVDQILPLLWVLQNSANQYEYIKLAEIFYERFPKYRKLNNVKEHLVMLLKKIGNNSVNQELFRDISRRSTSLALRNLIIDHLEKQTKLGL